MAVKCSKRLVTTAGIALVLLGVWLVVGSLRHGNSPSAPSPDLEDKIKLTEEVLEKKSSVFLSPEFLSLPLKKGDAFAHPAEAKGCSERALNAPSVFHAMHRENHFSAVLLGPSEASSPLCCALLASPVWELAQVCPPGYLFRPAGAGAWSVPDEEQILQLHPDPTDRARWLIGTAANLIAIRRTKDAELLLLYAEKTKCLPSLLLSTQASLAASRGRWNEALTISRQALSKNSSNVAARIILVRALIECGKPDEAYSEAKKLRSLTSSRNTEVLFLLARAAHASGDKEEEIIALREMITLAREHALPLGASLTYLGQAYGQNGNRGMALRTFDEALGAPELTEEQREMIRQLIAHLKPEAPAEPRH